MDMRKDIDSLSEIVREDYHVIVNYKMDKIEDLKIRLDGILERRSRDLCLRELFNFAKDP